MTLHMPQPALREALANVVNIARQMDADRLSVEERANAAVSHVVDRAGTHWPLSFQRKVLADAIDALTTETQATDTPRQPIPLRIHRAQPAPAPVSALAPVTQLHSLKPAPAAKAPADAPAPKATAAAPSKILLSLANDVTLALLEVLDFSSLAGKPYAEQKTLIQQGIEAVSADRKLHLNSREVSELVNAVLADMLGLGPLEGLLADPEVTDIMVNGCDQVYVERGGKLELTEVRFRDNAHVDAIANRIVSAVGRRIDEAQPMVDARLKDGSRVNITVPPLALNGPTITIRKFPTGTVKLESLVEGGSMSAQMSGLLALATYLRLNILVSGGTGSGKTTLINAMSQFIPEGERVVTIEDAAELRFQQPHVVRFETRPPNVEGKGEVTMRTLVRNALRMRPDRIIIGEVRGDEVLDLLQAMNTGHDGSMTTLHANSPREALTRVESMAALAGFVPGGGVVRRQLVDAVHLIVQVSRMRDGKRRITSISEIVGIAEDAITLQDLFTFQIASDSTQARVNGQFTYTGYRPKFASRAADYGVLDQLNAILRK
ncbi:CpaF family protein [Seohaeicola saemankumensis]|uniref:CpaF family protein n=1 Tax=Seohaeicola saemankumensis TaxID=481181 RepID=UPI001E391D90|nr:CpaF family protein [Seohaeicola saemankumensis]